MPAALLSSFGSDYQRYLNETFTDGEIRYLEALLSSVNYRVLEQDDFTSSINTKEDCDSCLQHVCRIIGDVRTDIQKYPCLMDETLRYQSNDFILRQLLIAVVIHDLGRCLANDEREVGRFLLEQDTNAAEKRKKQERQMTLNKLSQFTLPNAPERLKAIYEHFADQNSVFHWVQYGILLDKGDKIRSIAQNIGPVIEENPDFKPRKLLDHNFKKLIIPVGKLGKNLKRFKSKTELKELIEMKYLANFDACQSAAVTEKIDSVHKQVTQAIFED